MANWLHVKVSNDWQCTGDTKIKKYYSPQLGPTTEQVSESPHESPPHNVAEVTDWLTIGSRRLEKYKKAFFFGGGEEKKPNIWFDVPNKKLGFASPTGFRTSHSRSTIETKTTV